MTADAVKYRMWVHWEQAIVSFHPIQDYEMICFDTRENYQARVHILVQSGFRFQ